MAELSASKDQGPPWQGLAIIGVILFSVYLVSIIFEFILIINNDSNIINILSLLITMLYQIIYIINFE